MSTFSKPIALSHVIVRTLLTAASRSFSMGNRQPWFVEVSENALHVSLHAERSDVFVDGDCCFATMALGGFCELISIAATSLKLGARIAFHDEGKPKITIECFEQLNQVQDPLYAMIFERSTYNGLHEGPLLDALISHQLSGTLHKSASELSLQTYTDSSTKQELAQTLQESLWLHLKNPILHHEYFEMIRDAGYVGISQDRLLEHADLGRSFVELFRMHSKVMRSSSSELTPFIQPRVMQSSHVGVFVAQGIQTRASFFQAGRAMMRMWLQATQSKVGCEFFWELPMLLHLYQSGNHIGLHERERKSIEHMFDCMKATFRLQSNEIPIAIFRMSKIKSVMHETPRIAFTHFTDLTFQNHALTA